VPDYGNIIKKICFDSTDKLHADLKICLHYDNIKIREFFNEIIKGYVEKNEKIIAFVEELREKKAISKSKRTKTKRARFNEKNTIKQFGLNKNEIENIFDILEKERPEL